MCSIFGIGFLGLPEGQLPHDHLTGQPIYVTQLVNFPGVIAIDSPGFFASEGDLGACEIVRYQASGHFPHAANSFIALGYYARCYQNDVCMGVKDDHIFATGGAFGTGIVEVGELTALLNQAGL